MKPDKNNSIDVIVSSPVGKLGFCLSNGKLSSIQFLPQTKACKPELKKELQSILQEITAYFADPHHHFRFAVEPQGTPFQKTVWKALQQIPCGKTVSYQDLARKLKTSARAIGNACRKNPFPLIIPCHRVVSKKGLGGFCGEKEGTFIKIKRTLLEHEKAQVII